MPSKTTMFKNPLVTVPDAWLRMDQSGVIRYVNLQTELLFGYDSDDLIGQPIDMLVPEPLCKIYEVYREDYTADPRTRCMGLDLQVNGRQRDGTQFPVNINLSHVDTRHGLMVIAAIRDLTDWNEYRKGWSSV